MTPQAFRSSSISLKPWRWRILGLTLFCFLAPFAVGFPLIAHFPGAQPVVVAIATASSLLAAVLWGLFLITSWFPREAAGKNAGGNSLLAWLAALGLDAWFLAIFASAVLAIASWV